MKFIRLSRVPILYRSAICAVAAVVFSTACDRKESATTGATSQPARQGASAKPDARPRVVRPDSVRALYVNAWAAGSRTRMADLIRIADATEINAFIVDIKESDTFLTYPNTSIELARDIGADQRPASSWLPALVDTLRAHGVYAIARIVVFKDRSLAEKKPELAIRSSTGGLWRDRKGLAWVNPYDRRVWDYNIAIAREALDMGFSELQWDYVRFPDVTNSARAAMRYPGSDGKSRADNIRDFILYTKAQLKSYGAPVTADVFGLVTHLEGDVDIGQQWETVNSAADAVLPMVYPSHYAAGLYGFARPIANPYQVVRLALTDAMERSRHLRDSTGKPVAIVMGWLEAMSIRGARVGAPEVRAQIQAAYDAGVTNWALWNPGSKFTDFEGALRPAGGGPSLVERSGWKPPVWELPRQRLSLAIRKREQTAPRADTARSTVAGSGTAPNMQRSPGSQGTRK